MLKGQVIFEELYKVLILLAPDNSCHLCQWGGKIGILHNQKVLALADL
jgi:hypothetical protein